MNVRTWIPAFFLAFPVTGFAAELVSVIPKPASMERRDGVFELDQTTRIIVAKGNDALIPIQRALADAILQTTGLTVRAASSAEKSGDKQILLLAAKDARELGDEGYAISVTPQSIELRASKPAGAFYGAQTLRQLITRGEARSQPAAAQWSIPCVRIVDRPRFAWRGMHLDVARHFFDKRFVKRYIDFLAAYKINIFHLYLTDDQGWRLEIKRYPRLTEIGAWRKGTLKHYADGSPDDQRYGGYFTQDDIREIVRYAQERFITVVPGISMPGHSQAALAAYPELSSTGGPFEVWTDWGISKEVMDPGKEEVFRFVEGVLTEAISLFPSRYIHTGGDEVPRDRWKASPAAQARIRSEGLKNEDELQSYFTKRVERFLNSKNRELIGWDEILEGGLAPNAVVMSWRGTQGGVQAAQAGHKVVMTPHTETYFNYMPQKAKTGPGHPGFLPLLSVYHFDPESGLTPQQSKFVLGGQACLWTEYVPTPGDVEYLLFPRLLAMSEVLWSPAEGRNDQDFLNRLPKHLASLQAAGVRCAKELPRE